jgi:hypothetical protein
MSGVSGDRDLRLADNESLFRDINEAIASGQWPGEPDAPVGFRCECAQLGCSDLIELTPREYERIREDGRRFMVAIGHELPIAETVLEATPGYVIVEKRGEAGEQAEENDPRG